MNIKAYSSRSGSPYQWSAMDHDCLDHAAPLVGYGSTRDEAIADLERLMDEKAEKAELEELEELEEWEEWRVEQGYWL